MKRGNFKQKRPCQYEAYRGNDDQWGVYPIPIKRGDSKSWEN